MDSKELLRQYLAGEITREELIRRRSAPKIIQASISVADMLDPSNTDIDPGDVVTVWIDDHSNVKQMTYAAYLDLCAQHPEAVIVTPMIFGPQDGSVADGDNVKNGAAILC